MTWNAEVLNEKWKNVNSASIYKNCARCGNAFVTTTKRELCFDCRKHDRKTVYQGIHICLKCSKDGRTYFRYTKDKIVEIDVLHSEKGKVRHCRFYGTHLQDFLNFTARGIDTP